MRGHCVHWDQLRHFGKLQGEDKRAYFAHMDELVDVIELRRGERVDFDPIETDRGPRAVSVRRLKP
jgi:cold shock CspA family protein